MRFEQLITNRHRLRRALGFTMIELLVVFAVIAILFSAVLVGANTVLNKAKVRNTQAVLQVVRDALEEFRRESPMIITASGYRVRYGEYPPDEIEPFSILGVPGGADGSLAPGGAVFVPAPQGGGNEYGPMQFYTVGNTGAIGEHRDLAGMILAIRELTQSAASILDRIPDSSWSTGILDEDGNPGQFLDRNDNGAWDPEVDEQIRLLVDDWGVPLSYFAQRDCRTVCDTESSNAEGWNQTSTEIIRLNKGQPVVMSYGPNGRDQLTADVQTSENSTASMVSDWMDRTDERRRINDPYNTDNVYADPGLKERLAEGIPGEP